MPRPLLVVVVGTVIGSALIYLFYIAVRTRWPANYASSSNDFGMIVNRTILRYAAFALGPPYTVALLVSTTVGRAGGAGMVVAVLIGAFQVCYLRVPEIYRTLRYNHTAMRMPTVLTEVGLAVATLAVAALGGFGPGPLGFVVPPIDELFKSLWGTIFVAILAAIVIAKTRVQLDIGRLITRSRREVGPRLRELARSEAVKVDVDPDLAETVLLTENLQRPDWFRQLERIKGRLFPRGSYGVMQVSAERPISDEDSIVRAVAGHLRGLVLATGKHGGTDYESLRAALAQYNNDSVFVDLAMNIFWQVQFTNSRKEESDVTADGRTAKAEPPKEPNATTQANTEVEEGLKVDSESAKRAELLGQTARLCMLATASLSTATADELNSLNQSLGAFLVRQVERSRQQTTDSS